MTNNEQNETAEIDDYVNRIFTEMQNIVVHANSDIKEIIKIACKSKDKSYDDLYSAFSVLANMGQIYGDQKRLFMSKECANSYRLTVSEENKKTFQVFVNKWVKIVKDFGLHKN